MLGMYLGQQSAGDKLDESPLITGGYLASLVLFVVAWMALTASTGVTASNPFGRILLEGETASLLATAVSVSFIYIVFAILGFQIFRRFRAGPVVQFFGRNSMICFIIHMPLIYALSGWLYELPGIETSAYIRLAANLLIFYVGACLLSEWMRKVLKPAALRKAIEHKFGLFKEG
jgi:peptidoglycan/LPS O-acetylase OafA/YrhL